MWWEKQLLEWRQSHSHTLQNAQQVEAHCKELSKENEKGFIFLQQTLTFRRKQNIHKRGKLNEEFAAGMVVWHRFPWSEIQS